MVHSGKSGEAVGARGCPARAVPAALQGRLLRALPLGAILGLLGVAYARGWFGLLTLETIVAAHEHWQVMLQQHHALAVLAFALTYVAVAALCVPGGAFLTAAGGLAFGTVVGGVATVLGATAGACILFLLARSAYSGWLLKAEGPWLRKVRAGFEKSALSYLLFLRLMPVFPFWLVNVAAAVLGMPLRTFALATFIGIIPITFAFASAGAGLGSVIALSKASYEACVAAGTAGCQLTIPKSALFTKDLALALALLGLAALIPVIVKRWRRIDV